MITTLSGVNTIGKAKVIVDIVPKGNPEIRPAYAMKPSYITIHNTGNSGRGANAKAHNNYIHNMAKLKPKDTGYASWHFSVDDKNIYQHLPLNETAWHTGDGSGSKSGNMTSIGIEICENVDMADYGQAEENAIALTVYLLKQLGISVNNVRPHQAWSGKYCPRVILKRDGSFTPFHNRIKKAYAGGNVEKSPSKSPSNAKTYQVKKGDTLWGISKATGVSVANLKKYNGLKSDLLTIGQTLKLTLNSTSKPKSNSTSIKAVGTIQIANLNNFTYIYEKTSDTSKRLGTAKKGEKFQIAGSVKGWFEVIYKGKRAYVKDKYAKRV
ncbi:N-acetylmuramoyl-L-alanine amidase XlyA [Bacillus licheniformis]|uniref:N-acetylmuramoyl-L-alanine amidase n=1 Tax=Bacillus licheniformis TaxID=1402 RepID=UPI0011A04474|nr:N-acetylmuramoyl-L-alanine amidase [Bacillus licheniformis]TWM32253.1 N-acetylmuramoyl-L-alanine amidase XlyA [Bacillus licheniformis]